MSPDTVAFASTVFDPLASAAVLTQARLGQLPRPLDLPAALRPQDAAQAYAVQDAVVWKEFLDIVVKEREDWKSLYRACKELE